MAFVVLGVAAVVVIQSLRISLRMNKEIEETYRSSLLIEEQTLILEKTGNIALSSGEDPVLGPWSLQKDILPSDSEGWHFEQITLEWGGSPHAQSMALSIPFRD